MKGLLEDVPGLAGLKTLDSPAQPLLTPGCWDYRPEEVKPKASKCTENCCARSYLPAEVHLIINNVILEWFFYAG